MGVDDSVNASAIVAQLVAAIEMIGGRARSVLRWQTQCACYGVTGVVMCGRNPRGVGVSYTANRQGAAKGIAVVEG
jgi:hypothetical protein